MNSNFARIAYLAAGTVFTLLAASNAALADVNNGRGPPVLKCQWVIETECTQTTPNGPATDCHTHRVWDCEVVSGTGSLRAW